jgi:acyl transferase domain-containing protein
LGRRSLGTDATWIATCDDRRSNATLEALGQAFVRGAHIAWSAVYPRRQYRHVPLPNYPFDRKRHWIDRPGMSPPSAAEGAPAVTGRNWRHRFVDVLASSGDR